MPPGMIEPAVKQLLQKVSFSDEMISRLSDALATARAKLRDLFLDRQALNAEMTSLMTETSNGASLNANLLGQWQGQSRDDSGFESRSWMEKAHAAHRIVSATQRLNQNLKYQQEVIPQTVIDFITAILPPVAAAKLMVTTHEMREQFIRENYAVVRDRPVVAPSAFRPAVLPTPDTSLPATSPPMTELLPTAPSAAQPTTAELLAAHPVGTLGSTGGAEAAGAPEERGELRRSDSVTGLDALSDAAYDRDPIAMDQVHNKGRLGAAAMVTFFSVLVSVMNELEKRRAIPT